MPVLLPFRKSVCLLACPSLSAPVGRDGRDRSVATARRAGPSRAPCARATACRPAAGRGRRVRSGRRPSSTSPRVLTAASALAASRPASTRPRVDAPGLVLASPARARGRGTATATLDLVLEPRAGSRAGRGERHARRGHAVDARRRGGPPRPGAHREPRRPRAAVAAAGGARRRDRARRRRRVQASAFVRGGESRYARVLIDGVPVNQPGGAYDFGTVLPFELERVEVVRGAASSLYGSDALAGVVSLTTRRAHEPARHLRCAIDAEGGSFAWRPLRRRDLRRARAARLERGPAAAEDRQRAAERRLRSDHGRTVGRPAARPGDERARGASASTTARSARRARRPSADPTSTPRSSARTSSARWPCAAAARRFVQQASLSWARTHQLSLNPQDSGSYVPEWNGVNGAYEISDFPDPAGFQNQTARAAACYQGTCASAARHLSPPACEARAPDGRDRQPRRGAAAPREDELRRLPAGPRARRRARAT